jgi:zinc protease
MNKFLALASLLCCCFFTSWSQNAKPVAPVLVNQVEGIKEYKLNNGLRVLLVPDNSQNNIVVNITYLVGSRHEGYGESGMAHLLEHMMFKTSNRYK